MMPDLVLNDPFFSGVSAKQIEYTRRCGKSKWTVPAVSLKGDGWSARVERKSQDGSAPKFQIRVVKPKRMIRTRTFQGGWPAALEQAVVQGRTAVASMQPKAEAPKMEQEVFA